MSDLAPEVVHLDFSVGSLMSAETIAYIAEPLRDALATHHPADADNIILFPAAAETSLSPEVEARVLRFMGVAVNIAKKYRGPREEFDDLKQIAYIGLIQASKRFDPSTGNSFKSFAEPTIIGEILRHFRDKTWNLHVPRADKEASEKLRKAESELAVWLGHQPTWMEIAKFMGISLKDVNQARKDVDRARQATASNNGGMLFDDEPKAIKEDQHLVEIENILTGRSLLAHLDEQEREIVESYYWGEKTQAEIAEEVGISQVQVGRVLKRSIVKLREVVYQ
jgi:RNA polymerase sigma-B factor